MYKRRVLTFGALKDGFAALSPMRLDQWCGGDPAPPGTCCPSPLCFLGLGLDCMLSGHETVELLLNSYSPIPLQS